jgi:hypothetical protein
VFFFTGYFTCCNIDNQALSHLPKTGCLTFLQNSAENDPFINNPFKFTILRNYSDNFASIGTILESSSTCPLQKENIADPAFCFLRAIQYDGLLINVFSFDVLQSGTAEYIVTNSNFALKNGITIGSSKKEVVKKLGKPYKINKNMLIWRSSDFYNYLVFTIENGKVIKIRWHEERQPEFKGKIVWGTKYD